MGSPQTNPCLDSLLAYLRKPFAEMVALAKEGSRVLKIIIQNEYYKLIINLLNRNIYLTHYITLICYLVVAQYLLQSPIHRA